MDNNENTSTIPEVGSNPETVTQELPVVADPTKVDDTPSVPAEPAASGPIEIEEKPVDPNFVDRTTNPGVIGNIGNTPPEDPNAAVNENLKKVEVNYTPPSKGKTTALVLFFIFLIAFVIFLPDITSFINKYKAGTLEETNEKITTGRLVCTLESNTANLDKNYKLVFEFTDNQLNKLSYTLTTKGDPTADAKTLDSLDERCENLKSATADIEGLTVSCNYSTGKLEERQSFDYASLEVDKLDAAYAEAGGNHPQYTDKQDMDVVEKNMNASGYTCNREQ